MVLDYEYHAYKDYGAGCDYYAPACVALDYEYHAYKDYGAGYDYYAGYDQQDDYGMYGPTVYGEPAVSRGRGGRGAPAGMPRGTSSLSVCLSVFIALSAKTSSISAALV